MAFNQETETIETILKSVGLEDLIPSFHEADIDIDLLIDASDEEVKGLLTDIQVTPGNRLRITKQINRLKAGGMFMCFRDLNIFRQTLDEHTTKSSALFFLPSYI